MDPPSRDASSGSRSRKDKPEGPLAIAIREKLTEKLNPSVLEVINDSHLHAGHSAMRAIGGGGGETHFTVNVVSAEFEGKKQMQRHRLIYSTLKAELDAGLHALIIKAKTPLEAGEVQTAPASGDESVPAGP